MYCFVVVEAKSQKLRCGQGHIPSETHKGQSLYASSQLLGVTGNVIPDIPCWQLQVALPYLSQLSHGPIPHGPVPRVFVSLGLLSLFGDTSFSRLRVYSVQIVSLLTNYIYDDPISKSGCLLRFIFNTLPHNSQSQDFNISFNPSQK